MVENISEQQQPLFIDNLEVNEEDGAFVGPQHQQLQEASSETLKFIQEGDQR